MKYKLLSAMLALSAIELHSNFFGNKKPVAKFDEDQLQAIEDALAEKDTTALETTISEQETTINGLETDKTNVQNALNDAFALNDLEFPAEGSLAEAIAALGTKCKEYGDANVNHSNIPTNGIENTEDEQEPVYGFENVMNDLSKYPKLK